MRVLVFGCIVAFAASSASAQMLADFETSNPFSGGVIVTDPTDQSNKVLFVSGETVRLDLPAPLTPGQSISIDVYDKGVSFMDDPNTGLPAADSRPAGHFYGWNLGVSGAYNWGIALLNKTFLGGNGGYGWTGTHYDSWPQTGTSVFSVAWYGPPRFAESLAIIGDGTPANPDVPGVGAWNTWVFTFNADGSMTIDSGVQQQTTPPVETAITQVYIGSASGSMGQVWIDNVQIPNGVPAPFIPGDANGDGVVDLDDFVILKNNFGITEGATWAMGDFNGDGKVDLDDFVILKNNFGATAEPADPDPDPDPEPDPEDYDFYEDWSGGIDTTVWRVAGWVEHGGQTSPERVFVDDQGVLNMVFINDPEQGYLSAALQTRKEDFGYGRWEARLKPSSVSGVLNSMYTIDWRGGHGTRQEIDIEFLTHTFGGNYPGEMWIALHAAGKQSTGFSRALPFNPSEDFHIFGFDITPEYVEYFADGEVLYRYVYAENDITFDAPYMLKFNVWSSTSAWIKGPPPPNVETVYQIDWVRFKAHPQD